MSAAHLHLVLNHVPVVGIALGLFVLAAGIWRNSSELKKLSLVLFVLIAVAAIPAYLTGEPAEKVVKAYDVSRVAIEQHERAAAVALAGVEALGIVALGGLALFRRRNTPQWFVTSCLLLAIAIGAAMAWTANLGGQIRHPEIANAARASGAPAHALPASEDD